MQLLLYLICSSDKCHTNKVWIALQNMNLMSDGMQVDARRHQYKKKPDFFHLHISNISRLYLNGLFSYSNFYIILQFTKKIYLTGTKGVPWQSG